VTSASTVGSKKVPPSAWRLPPATSTRAPLASASATCSSTLATRLAVDQRALRDARFEAVADLQLGTAAASFSAKAS
jgi:hypothetical protein